MRRTERRLALYFLRNGYMRLANEHLRQVLGQAYKKGYEVRFVLESVQEAFDVRGLLRDAGLKPGNLFWKHNRIIVPVYGKDAQNKILRWAKAVRKRK